MFSRTIAKITSKLPSPLKYRLSGLRPIYSKIISLGEDTVNVETTAGMLRWRQDHLTSQTFLLGTYEKEMQERSEEHTSELQSRQYLVCRLLLEKKKHQ